MSNTPATPGPGQNVRAVFNAVLDATKDPDARARLQLLREYYCNPELREWLHDFSWQQTGK